MTSPHDRPLPPLVDLPPPRELPDESTDLVAPGEIIAESKGALARRLLRIFWAPGLVVLGLWLVLVFLYVGGASPAYWLLSLLVGLAEPVLLRSTVSELGFSAGGLWTAFLVLPLVGAALSLATVPLAPLAIAGMDPRRHLSESGFQRDVATRITAVLLAPPILVVAALPLTVILGLPQPWSGLGPGQLMSLALAAGAIMLAWICVRPLVSAPKVLDIDPASSVETTARLERDLERRRAAAKRVLAQDRRHLPPNPGTRAASAGLRPRGALTALALIARACVTWLGPAVVALSWVIFGITDLVSTISGMTQSDLSQVSSPLGWQMLAAAVPALGLVLLGVALAPGLAARLSENQRGLVIDQRTYASWAHRARVNPWEARAVSLTGCISAAAGLAGVALFAAGLMLLPGAATPTAWVWIVCDALILVPLLGLGAAAAMRGGLRDVLYGPAGNYTRRETPYALVAPEIGTRTQHAQDPAVRAAMRKRLQEQGGQNSLAIFDLDAAGERLWVDDSQPGAKDTAVREADLARGLLPDFGAEGSPLTSGGAGSGVDGSGPGADGSGRGNRPAHGPGAHRIPDSVPGLRED
ncbi:hypothetical protein ACFQS2_10755 [Brachybacterium sp. GCM10030267]|uniref:hypothetical protein n=1 Tax=unclassified Brachybacterium TaxID=2623841 RepID=UPI003618B90D